MSFVKTRSEFGLEYDLDGDANVRFLGTQFGNTEFSDPGYPAQIARIKKMEPSSDVFQMYSGFTNRVERIVSVSPQVVYPEKGSVITTNNPVDGLIANNSNVVTMQTNADCPAVIIYGPGIVANLHGGLNCLERDEADDNIINSAMRIIGKSSVADLRVFVAAGARECCFGHLSLDLKMHQENMARAERIKSRFGSDVVSTIVNPPREGGIGYDMFTIIMRILHKLSFKDKQIDMDDMCSSCNGLSNEEMSTPGVQGTFFSNLRQTTKESRGGRNALLVRLKKNEL